MNRLLKLLAAALMLLLITGLPLPASVAASGAGKGKPGRSAIAGRSARLAPSAKPARAGSVQEHVGVPAAEKPEEPAASPSLATAAQTFKSEPNEVSFADVFKALKALLGRTAAGRGDPASVVKANPALSDLGVKVVAAGGARIWSFPKIQQSQAVLIQWTETRTRSIASGRRRHKVVSVSVARVEPLTLPGSVVLKDARTFELAAQGEKPVKARYLVCVGSKRGTNNMWLASYREGADGWHEDGAPLTGIPPYLTSNISGIIGFSGSDLIVTVTPASSRAVPETAVDRKLPEPASSSYKLALRLVAGRFTLEGTPAEDTPYNAVFQFVHACEQGHSDLAKAWLSDPQLISIPKYVGISTRTAETPSRIINMSGTAPGLYRYRLVTFERYDLILDAARVKGQWAIKAIFIAPADPFLQKVARSLPPAAANKPSEQPEQGAK